jgi:putative endonuclease
MWPFRRKRRSDSTAAGGAARPGSSGRKPSGSPPLGPRGEKIARKFLRARGLKILAENYRCPAGEADLIALDASTRCATGTETIVFVEVKTRASDRTVDPISAVDADKQRRLRRVAGYYMSTRDTAGYALRFDVIAIVAPGGREPRIEHVQDAF